MNNKLKFIYCIFASAMILSGCSTIQTATAAPSPMIENYDKGELELMVSPFGDAVPINVGKVLADGTIRFDWPEVDLENFEDSEFHLGTVASALGMNFCNDKEITQNDDTAKVAHIEFVSLYKYGQPVGALYPATQKELEDNVGPNRESSLVLGSSISWLYSEITTVFEARCAINWESENNYSFEEVTKYDLQLKQGWNIVRHSLLEKEDWENGDQRGSLPKTINKTSLTEIPNAINWYMNYWANDELLDLERKLLTQTPVTQQAYDNWLPSKLGELERTSYAIGEKLETMDNDNNINITFSGNERKVDVTIVDSSGSKDTVSVFTMTMDMTGSEWKDESDTGYKSSTKMDGTPVLVQFNSTTNHTTITYNANDRFVVKALAENTDPKTLWRYLQGLQLDQLN